MVFILHNIYIFIHCLFFSREEYLNLLEERGLLQENERQSLEDLPTQQSSSSLYRNEGNNTDDITLSTFQHMLMDLTETKTRCHDAIDTAITNLNAQVGVFNLCSYYVNMYHV